MYITIFGLINIFNNKFGVVRLAENKDFRNFYLRKITSDTFKSTKSIKMELLKSSRKKYI